MNIETVVIPFGRDRKHQNLVHGYYMLRHRVFAQGLGWDLITIKDVELDEYDREGAEYVIAVDGDTGEVVGGARLFPTDHEFYSSQLSLDPNTYMIADAAAGLLEGLPEEICTFELPRQADVWELTRVAAVNPGVAAPMLEAANNHLALKGVCKCLAMGSPAIMRVARKLGYAPSSIGPIVRNESGNFLAFECEVVPPKAAGSSPNNSGLRLQRCI
ncbi:acyl-homoserine-lactone synthase [Ruegeria sp. HKCCD8929]|uniref:acyl-homoserine-lactone synthase n=1 Tax=Ruegeria sp. HKCCD8929 TaxID=2683006 RepID=UPI0014888BA9|nr:acyl-homoserine-lactone synthase [Ruegeria sp. HKCCD8929]